MLLHICPNIMKISLTVQSFKTDTMFIQNSPKENNSDKNVGLWFLFCAYCPISFIFVASCMKISIDSFNVIEWIRF